MTETTMQDIQLCFAIEGTDSGDAIVITARALEELHRIRQEQNIPAHFGLRIGIRGGGCSGFSYVLGFDAQPRSSDFVMDAAGIPVFIDQRSAFYLMGVMLDFADGLMQRGFTFRNPNAVRTCGCGHSFAV
ncbi:MAG: iron-sulfur cluster assembly accessory protein [Candidatus Kapabacteria bacterium]|nr:iron-sulfur cluster assembly accessory protein [Candidatus Kapabacteria bacterium]MDW7996647.1 iron-sulfur cluster assembly accessory protein [Bacteroidota bacterium]